MFATTPDGGGSPDLIHNSTDALASTANFLHAYRDHPRRQRCLAHLIRKALALAEGYYGAGSGFGRDLVRDLRRLIVRVHDGADADALERLTTRIKWNCQCNRHEIEKKVRDLAGEILNDWDAVIAFSSALSGTDPFPLGVADPSSAQVFVFDRRRGRAHFNLETAVGRCEVHSVSEISRLGCIRLGRGGAGRGGGVR